MEVWRDVVGYEGVYQVSNFGRVRRIKPAKGSVVGRILKPGKNRKGIKNVVLTNESKPKTHMVHRIVALAFLGQPPTERHVVAHNDGNASNNRLANLRWATPSENSFDQVLHGTQKGKHYGRKSGLTDDQVISIRMDQRTQAEVAKDFGIAPATVGQIRRRETYKHIPEMEGEYKSTSKIIRFTDDEIRAIRNDTRKETEIASEIGCSYMTIWCIKTKRSYAHVPDEPECNVTVSGDIIFDDVPRNTIQIVGDVAMIELASGYTGIFDAKLVDIVSSYRWYTITGKKTRYVVARNRLADGTVNTIYLHRILTDCPDDMVVDHINGDGLDNRMCNLRIITVAENNLNSRVRNDSQTGIRGAYYDKRRNSYYSHITINGKHMRLGTFSTAEEAAEAYVEASRKYHGEYGRTHLDD